MTLLDTNILLRFLNAADAGHATAKNAILALKIAGESICMVPQNLYEFWVVGTRPTANNGFGFSVAECEAQCAQFKKLFTLLPDSPAILAEWEGLVVTHDCKGKVAHDARLVASMRTHGVNQILTFNGADFQRFTGITILDPATVSAPPPPLTTP